MSTSIPPLVCSTPPPIDFDDDDDDNINNLDDNNNNNGNSNNNNHNNSINNNNNNNNNNYDVDNDDDDFSAFETNDGNFQTYVDSIPSTPTHVYDNSFSELQINDDDGLSQQPPPPPPPPDDFQVYHPKSLTYHQLPNNKDLNNSNNEQQQHDENHHVDEKIDDNLKSQMEQQFKLTSDIDAKKSTYSLPESDIENNINNNLNLVKGENCPATADNENQIVLNSSNTHCDNNKIIIDNYHHSIPYRNESPPSLILSQNDNSFSYNDDEDEDDDYVGDVVEDDIINENPIDRPADNLEDRSTDGIHDEGNEFNEFQENECIDATSTTTSFKLNSIKNPVQSSSSIPVKDEQIILENLNTNKLIVNEMVDNKIVSDADSINKTNINSLEEKDRMEIAIPATVDDDDDDDNFGDFNEFPLDNNLEKCTKPADKINCDINIKENDDIIVHDNDDGGEKKDIDDKGAIQIKDKDNVNTMDNNTNAVFVADFSQFSCSFETNENPINTDIENNLNVKIIQKNNVNVEYKYDNDNDFDEFDDFQNFTTSHNDNAKLESNSKNNSEIIKPNNNNNNGDDSENVNVKMMVNAKNVDEDDEDDFGDFNDFTQSNEMPINESNGVFKTTITNLKTIQEKVEPILMVMFPDQSMSEDDNKNNNNCNDNEIEKYIQNSISKYINDFENSKALQHQWINSKTKTTLITSLGIDSRNILHTGGKWNSSMPRFATNLGFSPLEPLKSDAITSSQSIHGIDNKHLDASTNPSIVKSTDVPAAQFDWNSSGLVNPLDGVQEILHKTSTSQNKSSWIETNRSTATTIDTIEQSFKSSSLPSSTTIIGTTTLSFPTATATTTNPETISNTETTNIKIIDKDIISIPTSSTITTTTTSIDDDDYNLPSTSSTASTIISLSMITPTIISESEKSTPPSILPIISQEKKQQQNPIEHYSSVIGDFSKTFNDNNLCESPPLPISSSYVIPGSGTLKETHIFTPTKGGSSGSPPPSSSSSQLPCNLTAPVISPIQSSVIKENPLNDIISYTDYDFEKSAAGIRINENVVKKEYRDIEYNPEKILNTTTTTMNNINDDFSDFQSVIPSTSASSSSSLPQIIPLTIPQAQQQHSTIDLLQPIKSETKLDNSFSFASSLKHNDDKKYTKPTIGISPTDKMFSSSSSSMVITSSNNNDDEFTDFQSSVEISQKIIPTISQSVSPVILQSIAPSASPSPIPISTSTSQQLPAIPQFVQQIPTTTTTILSPTNLLQPIQPQQTYDVLQPSNDKSIFQQQQLQINWPDPGIDPDEMARFEAIFPQKKINQSKSINQSSNIKPSITNNNNNNNNNNVNMKKNNKKSESPKKSIANNAAADDDDWSEFVSGGSTVIQPITHIINKNIIKHQISDSASIKQKTTVTVSSSTEDEWTDFVSNVQPLGNVKNHHNPPSWINSGSGPNFPSWNTPSSVAALQQSSPGQFLSGYTGSTSQMISPSQQYSNQFYTVPTITTNNNTNTNTNHHQQFHLKSHLQNSHHQSNNSNNINNVIKNPLSQRTPTISLIPDLGFISSTRSTNFHNLTKK